MLASSSSSKRLLVFHGSEAQLSQLEKTASSTEKHGDITTSCFNLEDLNNETKILQPTKANAHAEKSEAELRALLAAKEEMLEFYRREQLRRRDRFEKELKSRENTLTETLSNLRNLVGIEVEKNFKLERKVEALRSAQSRPQPQGNSQMLGYSDENCFEISKSSFVKKDETLLLESMMGNSSILLGNYL